MHKAAWLALVMACVWAGAYGGPGRIGGLMPVAAVVHATGASRIEQLDGLAEWYRDGALIVDGQRVRVYEKTKYKGRFGRGLATIPLGSEVTVRGARQADGTFIATEVDARPNGSGYFDQAVLSATNTAEAEWLQKGQVGEAAADAPPSRVLKSGPMVERVSRMVGRLTPPYRSVDSFRAYAVENKDWNAMAMANGAIWVYSGLAGDMDDDELALVVGHELAHVTHEHTRREFRRGMAVQLIALGVALSAEASDQKRTKQVVQLAALFSAMVYKNGYSRDLEDQADRVGLRYAYQGGYDISKAPRLWRRFEEKYGSQNKVVNYLFGGHSAVKDRVRNLERELALNYPDVRPSGPRP